MYFGTDAWKFPLYYSEVRNSNILSDGIDC
jgi:hypothetical protein